MSYKHLILLVFLLSLFTCLIVKAEDWNLVSQINNAEYYVDLDSIKKVLGKINYIEKGVFNRVLKLQDPPFNRLFQTYEAERTIDCYQKTVLTKTITTYDANERAVNTLSSGYHANRIKYDTVEASVYNDQCNGEKIVKPKEIYNVRFCSNPILLSSRVNTYIKNNFTEYTVKDIKYEDPTVTRSSYLSCDLLNGKTYVEKNPRGFAEKIQCATIIFEK
jgi:hypothetical protein